MNEIHCVTIESFQSSSSVHGGGSSGGVMIGGYGAASGSSKTSTIHETHIKADGRPYVHKMSNQNYPYTVGDKMCFLCEKQKTGQYAIKEAVNLSNGTDTGLGGVWVAHIVTWLFLGPIGAGLGAMFFGTFGVLAGLFPCFYLSFVTYPKIARTMAVLRSVKSASDVEDLRRRASAFDGKILINEPDADGQVSSAFANNQA